MSEPKLPRDREEMLRPLVQRAQELAECATKPKDKKRATKLLAWLLKQRPDLAPMGDTNDGTE
jgi:hypothetical protein